MKITDAQHFFHELETQQEAVIHDWISNSHVIAAFEVFEIPVDFFRRFFAWRIVDYLIESGMGRKPIGDCPAMAVMLQFFRNHTIPIDLLYSICATLRNDIIIRLIKSQHNSAEAYRHVIHIFDANFKRLIQDYTKALCHSCMTKTPRRSKKLASPTPTSSDDTADISNISNEALGISTSGSTVSAKEFFEKHDVESEDILELCSLEEMIRDTIYSMEYSQNLARDFLTLMENFRKFGTVIFYFEEFNDISKVLNDMGNLLEKGLELNLIEETILQILVLLEGLINDLHKWAQEIFIQKCAEDIHYLDNSIIASANQCLALAQGSDVPTEESLDDIFF